MIEMYKHADGETLRNEYVRLPQELPCVQDADGNTWVPTAYIPQLCTVRARGYFVVGVVLGAALTLATTWAGQKAYTRMHHAELTWGPTRTFVCGTDSPCTSLYKWAGIDNDHVTFPAAPTGTWGAVTNWCHYPPQPDDYLQCHIAGPK